MFLKIIMWSMLLMSTQARIRKSKPPTSWPTSSPSSSPTPDPSAFPTSQPSVPTSFPTSFPTTFTPRPTSVPSSMPTSPTSMPSSSPSPEPTSAPSSSQPTSRPSAVPTSTPTATPTAEPTLTYRPTRVPTAYPTSSPTISHKPTFLYTPAPTFKPSFRPSPRPTAEPTTAAPSRRPTRSPTSSQPTSQPSTGQATLVTIEAEQALSNIDAVTFNSEPLIALSFREAVVEIITGLGMDEVSIIDVQDINQVAASFSAEIFQNGGKTLKVDKFDHLDTTLSVIEQNLQRNEMRKKRRNLRDNSLTNDIYSTMDENQVFQRKLQDIAVNVDYEVGFIMEELGYTNATTAFIEVSTLLLESVASGAFQSALRARGSANGISQLDNVVTGDLTTQIGSVQVVRTVAPSTQPSSSSSDEFFIDWPVYGQILFPIGSLLVLTLVVVGIVLLGTGNCYSFDCSGCFVIGAGDKTKKRAKDRKTKEKEKREKEKRKAAEKKKKEKALLKAKKQKNLEEEAKDGGASSAASKPKSPGKTPSKSAAGSPEKPSPTPGSFASLLAATLSPEEEKDPDGPGEGELLVPSTEVPPTPIAAPDASTSAVAPDGTTSIPAGSVDLNVASATQPPLPPPTGDGSTTVAPIVDPGISTTAPTPPTEPSGESAATVEEEAVDPITSALSAIVNAVAMGLGFSETPLKDPTSEAPAPDTTQETSGSGQIVAPPTAQTGGEVVDTGGIILEETSAPAGTQGDVSATVPTKSSPGKPAAPMEGSSDAQPQPPVPPSAPTPTGEIPVVETSSGLDPVTAPPQQTQQVVPPTPPPEASIPIIPAGPPSAPPAAAIEQSIGGDSLSQKRSKSPSNSRSKSPSLRSKSPSKASSSSIFSSPAKRRASPGRASTVSGLTEPSGSIGVPMRPSAPRSPSKAFSRPKSMKQQQQQGTSPMPRFTTGDFA